MYDAIVVGGGVVGASTAYHLVDQGAKAGAEQKKSDAENGRSVHHEATSRSSWSSDR